MRKIISLLLTMAFILSCTATAITQTNQEQKKDVPYEQIIRDRFKDRIPSATETWKKGVKEDYDLILDHVDLVYEMRMSSPANEGKNVLVCGVLAVVAYAKDNDGNKKRVLGVNAVCHLFKDDKVIDSALIKSEPYVLLNGWDNSTEI